MSYKKESEGKKISIYTVAVSMGIIVFFAVMVSLFGRIFPSEILLFGYIPMSFSYFIWGLFTFIISTLTIVYVYSFVIKKNKRK